MQQKFILRGLTGFLLIILTACNPSGSSTPIEQISETTSVVTFNAESAQEKAVQIRPGQTLEVLLKGNPTTGYSWEVASLNTSILQQLGEPEFTPDSHLPGSGGIFKFQFLAQAVGETVIIFIYHRSWEQDVPPAEILELDVQVIS
jgi:inhibitor of cysteine peptidase